MKKILFLSLFALCGIALFARPVKSLLSAWETKSIDYRILPDGVFPVEYIEADGTQYLNTGIAVTTHTKVSVRCAYTTTATEQLFGSGYSGSSRFNFGIESRLFRCGYGNGWFTIATPDTNIHTFTLEGDGNSCIGSIDDISVGYTTTRFVPYVAPFYIGARSGTPYRERCSFRIYGCQMWIEGEQVRDMIPVSIGYGDDAVGAMFDLISGDMFYNIGTGNFIIGPDKED